MQVSADSSPHTHTHTHNISWYLIHMRMHAVHVMKMISLERRNQQLVLIVVGRKQFVCILMFHVQVVHISHVLGDAARKAMIVKTRSAKLVLCLLIFIKICATKNPRDDDYSL